MTHPDHKCPGGCGLMVAYARLACPRCWGRLPQPLRAAVTSGWARKGTDPLRHIRAVRAAMAWFTAERGDRS
jgi:hypothetical protein